VPVVETEKKGILSARITAGIILCYYMRKQLNGTHLLKRITIIYLACLDDSLN
jgi:hypothetical protein